MPPLTKSPKIKYLGVDPGYGGGLAINGPDGIKYTKMPATEYDIWNWLQLQTVQEDLVYGVIEKVHSMPKQGVASTFKFGMSYGMLRMALVGCGISFEEVTPQKWQKEMGVVPRRKWETDTSFKNRLKQLAQQTFPKESAKITLATADALLICKYCSRKHVSNK